MSLSFVTLDFANFNTSHVAVYPCTYRNHIVYNTISIHLMLLFIPNPAVNPTNHSNFNTSHVTVYRTSLVKKFNDMSFQYISCYCLSYLRHVYSHLSLNFNTSHVTVYQTCKSFFYIVYEISIHLMLLFIGFRPDLLFQ